MVTNMNVLIENKMLLLSAQIACASLFFIFMYRFIDKIFFIRTEEFDYFYNKESRFLITDNLKTGEVKERFNQRLQERLNQIRGQEDDSSDGLLSVSEVHKTNISFESDKLYSRLMPSMA